MAEITIDAREGGRVRLRVDGKRLFFIANKEVFDKFYELFDAGNKEEALEYLKANGRGFSR